MRVFNFIKSLEVTQKFTFNWINFTRFYALLASPQKFVVKTN